MCQWHSADSEEVHRVSWYFWLCAFSVHLIHWSSVQSGHHWLGWGENVEIMSLYTRAISLPVGQLPGYDSIYMLDVLRYYPIDFEVCDTSATPAIRSLGIPSFLTSLIFIIILLCLFICWSRIPCSSHSLFPDSEQSLALCYWLPENYFPGYSWCFNPFQETFTDDRWPPFVMCANTVLTSFRFSFDFCVWILGHPKMFHSCVVENV